MPCIQAGTSSAQTVPADKTELMRPIIYNTPQVVSPVGGNMSDWLSYNSSNGRFTVKNAGLYFAAVSAVVGYNTAAGKATVRLSILKADGTLQTNLGRSDSILRQSGDYQTASLFGFAYLSAGTSLNVNVSNTNSSSDAGIYLPSWAGAQRFYMAKIR